MAKDSEPKVAIIILTYSQDKLLDSCIDSIEDKTDYKNYKIFVIDNNSEKKIGDKIKKKFPKVRVVINDKNYGFSKGNNIGIDIARREYDPDYFLILNDDTETVQKNWLKKLIKIYDREKNLGILGCKLIYPDGKFQSVGGFVRGWQINLLKNLDKDQLIEVDHIMGAFMLIQRSAMDKLNGFDEDFSPYLLEDTDLCLRAKKLGFSVKSFEGVEFIHRAHQSFKSSRDKKLFFRFKNDIIFSWRHLALKDFFIRVFLYLPGVAMFKKESDESELHFGNFEFRKSFIWSLFYLLGAYFFVLFGGRGVKNGKPKKM